MPERQQKKLNENSSKAYDLEENVSYWREKWAKRQKIGLLIRTMNT